MIPAWATGVIAKAIVIGLAMMVAAFGGYRLAAVIYTDKIDAMKIADLQGVQDAWKIGWARRDHDQAIQDKSNKSNGEDQGRINANTGEVIRYVPHYITVKDDAGCKLPDGFGRLLDAALLGVSPDQLPADAGQSPSTLTPLALSQAAGLLAQTLGDYASVRARLLNAKGAWQEHSDEWARGSSAAPTSAPATAAPTSLTPATTPSWWHW